MRRKSQLPPLESRTGTEDILNSLLPPREWIESGNEYLILSFSQEFITFNMYLISLQKEMQWFL